MRDKASKGVDPSIPLQNEQQVSAGIEFAQQFEQGSGTKPVNLGSEISKPGNWNLVLELRLDLN
jgi:hypothetical protein